MTAMKAADAKEVGSSVTALANEKIKAEKEANAGKKKGELYIPNCISTIFYWISETRKSYDLWFVYIIYRNEEETASCW